MFRKALAVFSFVVFVSVPVSCLAGDSDYYSSGVGFGITLPEGWRFTERNTLADSGILGRLNDQEISEAITGSGKSNPLLAQIVNSTDDEDEPTVAMNINVMTFNIDMPLTELMDLITDNLEKQFMDFKIQEEVRNVSLCGFEGAYVRAQHGNTDVPYEDLPMNTKLWIVRRGDILFSIGATWAINEAGIYGSDIDAIVDAVRIDL